MPSTQVHARQTVALAGAVISDYMLKEAAGVPTRSSGPQMCVPVHASPAARPRTTDVVTAAFTWHARLPSKLFWQAVGDGTTGTCR
jgi:hypothetical protein